MFAAVLLAATGVLLAAALHTGVEAPVRFEGVTVDARGVPSDTLMPHLAGLGMEQVTLIAFGWQRRPDTAAVQFNPDARWYSESDRGIRSLAAQARANGMGVVIKPHLWIGRDGERSRIDFGTEAEWRNWERDYRTFTLHQARLAASVKADLFVVGTELWSTAVKREAFWRALISEVRAVYPGPVTYAANWWKEYEEVPFWDALDFIGVQAYFPLSEAREPSVRALVAGWQPHLRTMRALSRKVGKPVLFTEIGYRSVGYAAEEPWRWLSRDERRTGTPDYALQARLYEAFFDAVWDQPWFAGALFWKWSADRRGPHPLDFPFQHTPAEAVLADALGRTTR